MVFSQKLQEHFDESSIRPDIKEYLKGLDLYPDYREQVFAILKTEDIKIVQNSKVKEAIVEGNITISDLIAKRNTQSNLEILKYASNNIDYNPYLDQESA